MNSVELMSPGNSLIRNALITYKKCDELMHTQMDDPINGQGHLSDPPPNQLQGQGTKTADSLSALTNQRKF